MARGIRSGVGLALLGLLIASPARGAGAPVVPAPFVGRVTGVSTLLQFTTAADPDGTASDAVAARYEAAYKDDILTVAEIPSGSVIGAFQKQDAGGNLTQVGPALLELPAPQGNAVYLANHYPRGEDPLLFENGVLGAAGGDPPHYYVFFRVVEIYKDGLVNILDLYLGVDPL